MSNSVIKLNSGAMFDFEVPTTQMININDIVIGLSKESRFANQLDGNWTVLQHVLLVRWMTENSGGSLKEQFIALHHDDPEAWFKDIPTPLKKLLRDYQRLYNLTAVEIGRKFNNIDILNLPKSVKFHDEYAMLIEDTLFSNKESKWHDIKMEDLKDHKMLKYIIYLSSRPTHYLIEEYLNYHKILSE